MLRGPFYSIEIIYTCPSLVTSNTFITQIHIFYMYVYTYTYKYVCVYIYTYTKNIYSVTEIWLFMIYWQILLALSEYSCWLTLY